MPNEWISVKDRLPEPEDNPILVCFGFSVNMCWYHKALDEWELPSGLLVDAVTHWMPLPEPPKEGVDNAE